MTLTNDLPRIRSNELAREASASSIDAVITWVDGNTPEHSLKIQNALREKGNIPLNCIPIGYGNSRFMNNNEIEFCINGIRKFMPWVRNIYLVTDQQRPSFLTDNALFEFGVSVVDHKQIFYGYEWVLPTFNSISIETVLHRIPGLADRYIYFNDDVIPIAPSFETDFFIDNKTIVRGHWRRYRNFGRIKTFASAVALKVLSKFSRRDRSAHLVAQMRSARMAGFYRKFIYAEHAPHPIKKHTLIKFFQDHHEFLKHNIQFKFRNLEQFVTHPLAHHLEAAAGEIVLRDDRDCVTMDFAKPETIRDAFNRIESLEVKFICAQNLERAEPDLAQRLYTLLEERTKTR